MILVDGLKRLDAPFRLIATLLYGCGLRLLECLSLRLGDVDLDRGWLRIRGRTEKHDRDVHLPALARPDVAAQIAFVVSRHRRDLAAGGGEVERAEAIHSPPLPGAGYAGRGLDCEYLFPAARPSRDPTSGRPLLRHLHETAVQRAISAAVRRVALAGGPVTCRALRGSFATHLLDAGVAIRTVQSLLGHRDPRTTRAYRRGSDRKRIEFA